MVPLRSIRGRPKSKYKKLQVSVRCSLEVVAYFRSTGERGHARMDGVLRLCVLIAEAGAINAALADPDSGIVVVG